MSNFKTIDEARAYFSGDRFATENGMMPSRVWRWAHGTGTRWAA